MSHVLHIFFTKYFLLKKNQLTSVKRYVYMDSHCNILMTWAGGGEGKVDNNREKLETPKSMNK